MNICKVSLNDHQILNVKINNLISKTVWKKMKGLPGRK